MPAKAYVYITTYASYDNYYILNVALTSETALQRLKKKYPLNTKNMPNHITIEIWDAFFDINEMVGELNLDGTIQFLETLR